MSIFNLPDLGEGLPDAEICQWHVKVGDTVKVDQPLVSMETAKAVVEVPAPQDGTISELYGHPGDIIETGSPLVAFKGQHSESKTAPQNTDKGTVVGNIQSSDEIVEEDFTIGHEQKSQRIKAGRQARELAKQHQIDLTAITGSGPQGLITLDDVKKKAFPLREGFELIKGVRRTMARTMSEAHAQVVLTNIFDEVDISAWSGDNDITIRIIQALCHACHEEPALNAWFDEHNVARHVYKDVHLGLAMDSPDGLFVPVINAAQKQNAKSLRQSINQYKKEVEKREISPKNLTGATISLSNFGKFAGRFATPIIVPPMVAIIGVGQLKEGMKLDEKGKPTKTTLMPISVSFDHRAVTGGEATRFLASMITHLQSAKC